MGLLVFYAGVFVGMCFSAMLFMSRDVDES